MFKDKALSQTCHPIKHSQQYIDQIAELKKQNADPDTIKLRAEKYAQMKIDKWRPKKKTTEGQPPKPQSAHSKQVKKEEPETEEIPLASSQNGDLP
jgi:hypothetical protein